MEQINQKFLPLYFAPNIHWFMVYLKADSIVLVNDLKFPKQTFRNRINYGTFQGLKSFSIPIKSSSKNADFQSVEIDYTVNWTNQLKQALKTSYNNSPFFEYYYFRFEAILNQKPQFLWDFNLLFLNQILHCLKVSPKFQIESKVINEPEFQDHHFKYYQVFEDQTDFISNLSVLDLIFNEGIDATRLLMLNF